MLVCVCVSVFVCVCVCVKFAPPQQFPNQLPDGCEISIVPETLQHLKSRSLIFKIVPRRNFWKLFHHLTHGEFSNLYCDSNFPH